MEDSERIAYIRAVSKGAEELTDEQIQAYLDAAKYAVLNRLYPFSDLTDKDIPARYEFVQLRVAIYNIHKRGAEGETKHIEVGTERDYPSADIPNDLLKEIIPMCGVPR